MILANPHHTGHTQGKLTKDSTLFEWSSNLHFDRDLLVRNGKISLSLGGWRVASQLT